MEGCEPFELFKAIKADRCFDAVISAPASLNTCVRVSLTFVAQYDRGELDCKRLSVSGILIVRDWMSATGVGVVIQLPGIEYYIPYDMME